jgi:hypothetical protein
LKSGTGRFQKIAQPETFPPGVADQAGIQSVADAHQRGFLFDGWNILQMSKSIGSVVLDQAGYFQTPKIDIHSRIDHIFGHAIEQTVWCDRLDDTAFVLRAVVTEGRSPLKLSA